MKVTKIQTSLLKEDIIQWDEVLSEGAILILQLLCQLFRAIS
jgi:hypothetical protein